MTTAQRIDRLEAENKQIKAAFASLASLIRPHVLWRTAAHPELEAIMRERSGQVLEHRPHEAPERRAA